MAREYGGWAPYVPVAERRKKAEREMAKLRKKGHPVAPVRIEGRTIATTFWGKAWCDNLESYRDYENRLPRGRAYVRTGSVIDLQIAPLQVKAMVSGSSIYVVTVSIKAVPKAQWQSLCRDCASGIDSLVELLQGRFSGAVMERLCRQGNGLFPKPMEIRFSCSCSDSASMCKHVAAVLYGIGSRLDEKPELLFRLRSVDEKDLVANLDPAVPLSKTVPAAGRLLEIEDVSGLFGLDMAGEESPVQSRSDAPPASKPTAKARQARGGGNTGAQKRSNQNPTTVDHTSTEPKRAALKIGHTDKQSQPMAQTKRHKWRELAERFMEPATIDPALAALEPTEVSAPLPTFRNAESEKLAIKRYKATQTVARAEPIQPPSAVTDSEPARLKTASMRSKVSTRSRPSKPALELTPDGFVKWWK
jgi:uncharacterized Zn finger protein